MTIGILLLFYAMDQKKNKIAKIISIINIQSMIMKIGMWVYYESANMLVTFFGANVCTNMIDTNHNWYNSWLTTNWYES